MPRFVTKNKIAIFLSIVAVAAMIGTAIVGGILGVGFLRPQSANASVSAAPAAANQYPTTTMQEPGYTNGTYVMAATNQVQHLNIYQTSDLYSFYLLDEIYDPLYNLVPNDTIVPWLATGYTYANVSANPFTTVNPITGQSATVNYTYNVTLRPGVQWTDWTPANSANTYVYDGITMNTHTVQAADVILSWLILQSSADFSGTYLNVVNITPINNLTVQFDLSGVSATFTTITLLNPILPYHIWVNHDWATTPGPGIWNGTGKANGYDTWNMGFNSNTFTASGMVGTGPFMFTSGYGMPAGYWNTPTGAWQLYVNPHYFVQYVPSLQQFTPKIYSVFVPYYASASAAITALTLGQVDTVEGGMPSTFISTVSAAPNTFIYYHPGSGYGFMQFNTYPYSAPFNITAFRQALNYAVDKTYIASVIDQGYVVPGNSIIPLSDSTWHNFSLPQYNYNPSLTASMISNITGMSKTPINGAYQYNGKPVSANIEITSSASNPLGVEAAQLIASEWTSLGVPTTVSQVSFVKLVADLITSNFHEISLGITGITGDPTSFLTAVYNNAQPGVFYQGPFSNVTYGGVNYTGTQVQEMFNTWTNQLNTITNLRDRIALANEIQGLAAAETTEVIFGYGVDIYPFYNGTFTGITQTNLPQAGMIAFTFDSVYLKGHAQPTPPAAIPTQLQVGVVSNKSVYFDGQSGSLTIQVRNQFGQPVSGVSVAVGYNPTGGVLNVSSTSGTTNSAGQYTFNFKIFSQNQGMYTSDYAGAVNVSVAAFENGQSGVSPGLGYTHIDTAPMPVTYVASTSAPNITKGMTAQTYTLTVTDAAGAPVSGYRYTIQALTGAVTMATTSASQSISESSSYNAVFGTSNLGAVVNNPLAQALASTPSAVTIGPNGNVYVANGNGTVSEFYPTSYLGTVLPITNTAPYGSLASIISTGGTPNGIAFNASGDMIVANSAGSNLTVFSGGASVVNFTLAAAPNAITVANNLVYAALASGVVEVINETTWTTTATITVGSNPDAMAWNSTGFLYVANGGSGNVTIINASAIGVVSATVNVGSIFVGTTPDALAFNASGYLYVANAGSNNVTVVSNTTGAVISNFDVGTTPVSIAMDGSGNLYVANSGSGNVTVVSAVAAKTVTNITTGTTPTSIVYNPNEDMLYETNSGSNNMTVISSMATVTTVENYYLTSITGVTGSNGQISVTLSEPSSLYSYSANGAVSSSYLFLGNYATGGAVSGLAPYQSIGELTSASNANGFGQQQPVEIPLQVLQSSTATNMSIALTTQSATVGASGTTSVNIAVTNTTDGSPVANYAVTLTAQNALGANRGYMYGTGTQIQAFNPNEYFGSVAIPGITVVTNKSGEATVTFSPMLYGEQYSNNGATFAGYSAMPYTDNLLIPFDEWQIAAMGATGGANTTTLTSAASVTNPGPSAVVASFIGGASILNGVNVIGGNSSRTLYVNSTANTTAGPGLSGVSVNVSVSLGTVGGATYATGTTGSSGSFSTTFAIPNVSVMTPITITVTATYNGATSTYTTTYYALPSFFGTTTTTITKTVYHNTTSSSIPTYMYGVVGLFVVLTVVFGALYAMARAGGKGGSRGGEGPENMQRPPQN